MKVIESNYIPKRAFFLGEEFFVLYQSVEDVPEPVSVSNPKGLPEFFFTYPDEIDEDSAVVRVGVSEFDRILAMNPPEEIAATYREALDFLKRAPQEITSMVFVNID